MSFYKSMILTIGLFFFITESIIGLFIGLTYLNLDSTMVNTLSWIVLIFGFNFLIAILIFVGLRK